MYLLLGLPLLQKFIRRKPSLDLGTDSLKLTLGLGRTHEFLWEEVARAESHNLKGRLGLGWVTLQSMLLASTLASLRRVNVLVIHCIGLAASILLIQNIGTSLLNKRESGELTVLWDRLSSWVNTAITGGISDDPLPLTLWIVTISWLISYGSAWSVIRHKNIWGGILPSSIALITALSYLPESFSFYFFMYITFTINFGQVLKSEVIKILKQMYFENIYYFKQGSILL